METTNKEAFAAEWRERFRTKRRLDVFYASHVSYSRKREMKQWQRWLIRKHNSPLPENVKQELAEWREWFTKEELPGGMWQCVIAFAMWKDDYFEKSKKEGAELEVAAARQREAFKDIVIPPITPENRWWTDWDVFESNV